MHARVAVIEGQRLIKIVPGAVHIAEIVPAVSQTGLKQDGLLAVLEGGFIVSGRMQGHAQVAVCYPSAGQWRR